METETVMLTCAVIAAIFGLVMYCIVKRKNELFEQAITAEDIDTEAITKAYSYGKIPFIIALVIGAIAVFIIFILTASLFFSGPTTKLLLPHIKLFPG